MPNDQGPPPEWQKPVWLRERDGALDADEPDLHSGLLSTAEFSSGTDYRRHVLTELLGLFAQLRRLREITNMITDMRAWAMLVIRYLAVIRADSDTLLRNVVVSMVNAKHIQQQEVARLTGFSRNTISAWVRQGVHTPEPREKAPVEEPATRPEPQPVVAAIVTSKLGVLAGKRNDGKPPWTFIAGEIEPGESPADAAIREVKEEAGLNVATSHVLGRRVHPKTGRTMIYLACQPTEGTDVHVGDPDELAEVRWLSLAEADQLLPGMYEPVRNYLATMIA
jgi:8-oxo-dGTP pyrophosphatase MutT (NUDIX family)